MSDWSGNTWGRRREDSARGGRSRTVAAALGGAFVWSCVAVGAPDGVATDPTAREGSVLVATRQALNSTEPAVRGDSAAPWEDALEPISEVAEHVPEAAISDEDDESAALFGAALSEVVSGSAASPPPRRELQRNRRPLR